MSGVWFYISLAERWRGRSSVCVEHEDMGMFKNHQSSHVNQSSLTPELPMFLCQSAVGLNGVFV